MLLTILTEKPAPKWAIYYYVEEINQVHKHPCFILPVCKATKDIG